MNRNNGRKIAERLMLLQDYFIKNADKTHAVRMEEIRRCVRFGLLAEVEKRA